MTTRHPKSPWTPETVARVAELRLAGFPYSAIARDLGEPYTIASVAAKSQKLAMPKGAPIPRPQADPGPARYCELPGCDNEIYRKPGERPHKFLRRRACCPEHARMNAQRTVDAKRRVVQQARAARTAQCPNCRGPMQMGGDYCSPKCRNKASYRAARRRDDPKVAIEPGSVETVEQYLARGGRITRIENPPPSSDYGIPVNVFSRSMWGGRVR